MGKQHDTFPGETPEMPVPKEAPEIKQPNDPKGPEIPQEDPQITPEEFPKEYNPQQNPAQPDVI